jgi:mono/diheme cytochrome c family protein
MAKKAYEKAKEAKASDKKNPKEADAAAQAAGKASYEAKCALCHGAAGKGDGVGGQALPQKPADFSWKERWDSTSIGEKHWVVINGITGTGMTPQGMTDDQAWEVLAYIQANFAPK